MRSSLLLASSVLLFAGVAAHADTISTFSLENTAFTPGSGTFSGTVTVNTTTGLLTAINLTASGFQVGNGQFTTIFGQNKGLFDPVYVAVLFG